MWLFAFVTVSGTQFNSLTVPKLSSTGENNPRDENNKIVHALLGMPKCLVINLMLSTVISLIIASS